MLLSLYAMSNSRAFRRNVKSCQHPRPSGTSPQPRKQPWNKGLALTSTPTLGTVRRWMNSAVGKGIIERKGTQRTGRPGRPAVLYGVTGEGREQSRSAPTPAIYMEQVRRHENARKRRKLQRENRRLKAQDQQVAKTARRVAAAAGDLEKAEERLLAAELAVSAIKALMASDGDASALLPEEISTLTESGILAEKDGHLLFAEGCTAAFDRLCAEADGPA